jgi:hypothetical protein
MVSAASRRPAAVLGKLRSSTSAAAMAVFLATRVIAVVTGAYLLQLHAFRRIHDTIWTWMSSAWDSYWYAGIAAHGYSPHTPGDYHFFPGYPAAIDAVAWIPGMGIGRAGVVVTTIAGLAAAAGIAQLSLRLTSDSRTAVLVAGLWAVAPGALVLSMTYAEALFCALAAWALVALIDRRWILAGALAFAAGTVRNTGSILAIAIAVAALIAVVQAFRSGRPSLADWLRPVAAAIMAPLGVIGFWVFVAVQQGQPGGWLVDEEKNNLTFDWGRGTWDDVIRTFTGSEPEVSTVLVLAVLAAVALAVWGLTERIPVYLQVYTLGVVALGVLTSANWLGSKPRIMLPAFLLGLPLAKVLAPVRNSVLVPMMAIMAVASAWFTLFAATRGWPP